ncbi:MAG TPA: N-acetylglucosamine-6-phosphate deacetylase [Clostridiales bacterium]|nr:N-acetylglucosamine-6-phosphate deacetylase [Clostridiales bacterium]
MEHIEKVKIINGNIITPFKIIKNGCITIENGKITGILDEKADKADKSDKSDKADKCCRSGNNDCSNVNIIDAGGKYVAPGFIDIHTHGGGGHDFLDATVEAYLGAAEKHIQHGTTALVPTTTTSTNEELKETFAVYKKAKKENKKGSQFLGLHLEGPYFAMSQKGAQDPRFIRSPKREEYEKILEWTDDIIRWSAAPELDGALEFGRLMKEKGILPSIAHTDAIYEDVLEAFENGFTHVTHLYSATSMVRRINAYRYAGVVEAAYLIDEMTVEIIADGSHLPASLLKLIYKIKGADHVALVTDSIRAAGQPEGESIIGSLKNGMPVIVEDGVAKLPDRTAFAGSVATADRLVRNMVNLADVPLIDAVKMMTLTPASIIGVSSRKGSIVAGKDADIVIFDKDINIDMAIVGGQVLYKK